MTGHVRKRGKNSWEIKFDIAPDPATGERRIRYHSFKGGKKEAHAKLAELLTDVGKGAYVDASKLTVAEHVRARVAQWEASGDISAKTAERYSELVENQIVPHIGAKEIQKLKTADIESWHTTLKTRGRKGAERGISNRTIGHAHRVLSKALKDGARHDLVIKNVASDEGVPTVDDKEMIILTPDQVRDLPVKLAGDQMFTPAMTSLFTGVRRGELLALRWSNTDLDAKVIKIREALEETKIHGVRFKKTKTKNGRRDITLPDIVVDALREHRKAQLELRMALGAGKMPSDALVFPGPDFGPLAPDRFSSEWRHTAIRIGFVGIPLQSLRHTHASQLIDSGVDVVTISKRLGHASPAITLKVYAHLFRKDDGKAAAAINSAMAAMQKA